MLLGGAVEGVTGPTDPPVGKQENTALLSGCGLAGTPLRVFLSGLGGRECSTCVHSVDGDEVGLHSPLLVDLRLFVFVIRAAYFRAPKGGPHQSPLRSHLKNKGGCRSVCSGGTKTDSTCYTLLSLPYNTLSTNAPIKQASLRSSTRSIIERRVEPLGSLNKGYTVFSRGLPFDASYACTGMHNFSISCCSYLI